MSPDFYLLCQWWTGCIFFWSDLARNRKALMKKATAYIAKMAYKTLLYEPVFAMMRALSWLPDKPARAQADKVSPWTVLMVSIPKRSANSGGRLEKPPP